MWVSSPPVAYISADSLAVGFGFEQSNNSLLLRLRIELRYALLCLARVWWHMMEASTTRVRDKVWLGWFILQLFAIGCEFFARISVMSLVG